MGLIELIANIKDVEAWIKKEEEYVFKLSIMKREGIITEDYAEYQIKRREVRKENLNRLLATLKLRLKDYELKGIV